ncbi:NAD(P)H-dependent oxidoreductase [Bacillus cereus]|nr:NAD(P)H-dependent oxidoreductase [Bacillus cereus]MCD2338712.1 NAD(P)H-dependent oxidoreductase [Bacillus cereus]
MRLALVCGSVREESQTKKLMKQIQSRFADKDIELDFIDFRESLYLFLMGLCNKKWWHIPLSRELMQQMH